MNKEEKIVFYIISILILIFLCTKILNIKDIKYTIKNGKNKFDIKENYNKKYYKLIIKKDKYIFPINIYNNINNSRKIVTNIYYYKDKTYECIFPIIKDKVLTDIMCYKDRIIYNYNEIRGESSKLDNYVNSIKEYKIDDFNNKETYTLNDTIKIYDNKINNIVSTTTYKGLYINGMQVNLFKKDVYSNKINTYIDNYYLTADYNNSHEFKNFYLVNLENSEVEKIRSKEPISFDSYIQGIVDNKIYLYDIDNEIQYEIDIYSKKVNVTSNKNYIKYYTNTKWEKLSKSKVKRNTYFDYTNLNNYFTDYDYVKESDDYYYLINKLESNYKVYRVNKNNLDIITYIGIIPTLDINPNNDYFYYTYDNILYFYSDKTGFKALLENTEKEFNERIKYYIY